LIHWFGSFERNKVWIICISIYYYLLITSKSTCKGDVNYHHQRLEKGDTPKKWGGRLDAGVKLWGREAKRMTSGNEGKVAQFSNESPL
jgi:hypothetical protein